MAEVDPPSTRSVEYSATCPECGYDLRGTSSTVCPECGNTDLSSRAARDRKGYGLVSGAVAESCASCRQPLGRDVDQCPDCGAARLAWLETSDMETFHKLRALLEHNNFLVKVGSLGNSMAGLAQIYGFGSPGAGMLWVEAAKLDLIDDLLASQGISVATPGKPIVDCSEPVCPACGGKLDPQGEPVCPACGESFEWVDIEAESEGEDDAKPVTTAEGPRGFGGFVDIIIVILAAMCGLLQASEMRLVAIVLLGVIALLMVFRLPAWIRFLQRIGMEGKDESSPDA